MRHLLKKLVLVFIAGLMLSTPSFAAKKFVVGVENLEFYPLYSWDGKNYSGFFKEFLDGFAESKGYTLVYKGLPVKRLYKSFFKGKVDFKYPDSPYWGADLKKGKSIHYSNGVVEYIDGTVVLKENKGKGIGAVKNLGIVRGFTAWDYLGHIKAGKVKINESNGFDSLLKKLMKNRVSGAYANIAVANYIAGEKLGKKGVVVFDPALPHTKGNYQISTMKYPSVIKELNTYIKKNKTKIAKLKKKYKVTI